MAESGFPGFEAVPWFGLLAPTGTPKMFWINCTAKPSSPCDARGAQEFDELGLDPSAHAGRVCLSSGKKRRVGKSDQGCRIKLGNSSAYRLPGGSSIDLSFALRTTLRHFSIQFDRRRLSGVFTPL